MHFNVCMHVKVRFYEWPNAFVNVPYAGHTHVGIDFACGQRSLGIFAFSNVGPVDFLDFEDETCNFKFHRRHESLLSLYKFDT